MSEDAKKQMLLLSKYMADQQKKEMSNVQAHQRLKGKLEKDAINQLGQEGKKNLFDIQIQNAARKAEIVQFLRHQLLLFKRVSTRMAVRQRQYFNARKRIWAENDKLNIMEHQKVYEERLSELLIYFKKVKFEVEKQMNILEKQARYLADKINDKLLVKVIKKIAKKANKSFSKKQKLQSSGFWMEEVDQMRNMDIEYMEHYQEALKVANIQEAKFISKEQKMKEERENKEK